MSFFACKRNLKINSFIVQVEKIFFLFQLLKVKLGLLLKIEFNFQLFKLDFFC